MALPVLPAEQSVTELCSICHGDSRMRWSDRPWNPGRYTAPGDYYLRREYAVTDNYGQRYGFANIPVTEEWHEQFDECNIRIVEQPLSGFLQSSGTFPDEYGHVPGFGGTIPACSYPEHSSCETGSWQTYHLERAAVMGNQRRPDGRRLRPSHPARARGPVQALSAPAGDSWSSGRTWRSMAASNSAALNGFAT